MSPTLSPAIDPASASPHHSPDILCFSHLRWHFVTQRPQHLLKRAARERRVFFWEEPVSDGEGDGYLEIIAAGEHISVARPHLAPGDDADRCQRAMLGTFLRDFSIDRYICWYYTPMALGFTELNPEVTVYDCMDELSAFQGAPPELHAREHQLFRQADVVFTGGMSLYESKRRQHPNVHAFPSSIDVTHFRAAAAEPAGDPEDQAAIPHPRAGFYGVLDERFDIALMAQLTGLRPGIHFVLIGPIVKIDPAILPQGANLHYLGPKSYTELPAYLAGWDIALLPFALNESTRFISPTKTPEYLAAGKAVVSTPIHDVVHGYGDEGLVAIAGTPEEFAAALDAALQPPSPVWCEAVEAKLATNSWDRTWAAMWKEIERVRAEKASRLIEPTIGTP